MMLHFCHSALSVDDQKCRQEIPVLKVLVAQKGARSDKVSDASVATECGDIADSVAEHEAEARRTRASA